MLRKSVIICLAAAGVAAVTALMATGASAGGRGGAGANVPSPGTWNWPPYSGSFGGMPGNTCGYVRVRPYRSAQPHWVYQCH